MGERKNNAGGCGLTLSGLSKTYGGEAVLRNLSLSFPAGGRFCLMAPSGTGKTTLFRLILGLEEPDRGSIAPVLADGSPLGRSPRFAAVFQEDRLLEGYTVLENLRLVTGKSWSDKELFSLALRLLPEDSLKKPVREFSGGMKRRTAILRALLAPSDILLMDEPFSGLDVEAKKKTAGMILEFSSEKLLLLSAHSREEAALLQAEIVTLCRP